MSWNPYDNLPPAASFSLTSSDLKEGEMLAMGFADAGYGLLLLSFRGFDANPGSPSEQGLYRDGRAALAAYDTTDPHTASAIAAETLEKLGVQQAVAELLDANGLSDRKLLEIHARFLTLHASPDPQEKALALKHGRLSLSIQRGRVVAVERE